MPPWDTRKYDVERRVPTMVTREELRYLRWLAERVWTAAGHVVEIGPWLGGSTLCLAEGMTKSARPAAKNHRLHVYDSFVWLDFMEKRHPLGLSPGDSFEAAFRENLRGYEDLLVVHRAHLSDDEYAHDETARRGRQPDGAEPVTWTASEPVEILFVDGAKSWMGFKTLLDTFAPSFIPGTSRIVLQDYKYWGSYWVAAIAEFLGEALERESGPAQNTVPFRVVSSIEALAQKLPAFDEIAPEECDDLLLRAAGRLAAAGDRTGAAIVRLGRARMWVHRGDADRAREVVRESEGTWPLLADDANLAQARAWLQSETGGVVPKHTRTLARALLRRPAGFVKKRLRK